VSQDLVRDLPADVTVSQPIAGLWLPTRGVFLTGFRTPAVCLIRSPFSSSSTTFTSSTRALSQHGGSCNNPSLSGLPPVPMSLQRSTN